MDTFLNFDFNNLYDAEATNVSPALTGPFRKGDHGQAVITAEYVNVLCCLLSRQ